MDLCILQTSGKNKVECLSTLISSGGVVAIGFLLTRAIDLMFEFHRFRILGVEKVVTRSQELRIPNSQSPDRIRTVRSWEDQSH